MDRFMDKKEMKDVYELWRECFFDTEEYTDFYFRYKVPVNEISTIYDNHDLISMLHLNPYRLHVKQREVKSKYIVGVATKKEYRKKGYMKRILTKALNDMWKEKLEFAYLMPAAEKIYYPYSFRYVYAQNRAKMIIDTNDTIEEKIDAYKDMEILTTIHLDQSNQEKSYQELVDLSNILFQQHFDCYTIRDKSYYEELHHEMISTKGNIVLLYKGVEFVGYFSYMVNGDEAEVVESVVIPHYKDVAIKTIFIYFYEYLHKRNTNKKDIDKKSLEGITIDIKETEIKNKENPSNKLAVTFLETYFLKDIERIISDVTISKTPIIMARIIHFEEFMRHMRAKKEMTIIVRVIDPDIKANEGVYELKFEEKQCSVKRTNKKEEISLDIAELTKIAFGSMEFENNDNVAMQSISDDVTGRLQMVVSYKRLYINEIV